MQIYKAFSCGIASNLKDHILDANKVKHWYLAQLKRVNWITKLKTVHWEIQLNSRQKLWEFHCWWLSTSKLQVMILSGEIYYKRETNPRRILIWMFTHDWKPWENKIMTKPKFFPNDVKSISLRAMNKQAYTRHLQKKDKIDSWITEISIRILNLG